MAEDSGDASAGKATAVPPSATRNPGDQATPGTPQTGMVSCPDCHGTGTLGKHACRTCGGTGQIVQMVGDA
jgi:DnaJ-class molecular chaperone